MLQGNTTGEKIYRYLYSVYNNHYGVSALMGYLHDLSGLDPKSVDVNLKKRLKDAGKPYCTDSTYTDAVDREIISRADFITPYPNKHFSYGLFQWKDAKQKATLYDFASEKNLSIGSLEMQLELLVKQMQNEYKPVHDFLVRSKSIKTAVDTILRKFSDPNKMTDRLHTTIAGYGSKYYDLYAEMVANNPTKPSNVAGSTKPAPIVTQYEVGDKVIVDGLLFGYGNGTGTVTEKHNAVMYVVNLVSANKYNYPIGVAGTKDGTRVGWTSPEYLKKGSVSSVNPLKEQVAKSQPKSKLLSLAGDYETTERIYMRNDAGMAASHMVALPQGTRVVSTKGEYTSYKGSKWMYVEVVYKKIKYTGFCSVNYLKKVDPAKK